MSIIATVLFLCVLAILFVNLASVPATSARTISVPSASARTTAARTTSVPSTSAEEVNNYFEDNTNDMAHLYIEMCHAFSVVHEVVYSTAAKEVVNMDGDFTMGSICVPFAQSYQWQYSADGGKTWANAEMDDNNTSCVVIRHDRIGAYRCVVYTDRYAFVSNEIEIVDNNPMDIGGFIVRSYTNGDYAAAKEIAVDYLGGLFGKVAAARLNLVDIVVSERVCNIEEAYGCAHLLDNCIEIKANLSTYNMAHVLIHEYMHFLIAWYRLNVCGLFKYQEAEIIRLRKLM